MGFASEWATPGAFRTDDHAGLPILVVRGADGRLRAFLNVCRHRGAKVADGAGTARPTMPGRTICPAGSGEFPTSAASRACVRTGLP
jgi:phenylpropionate dioxygenase-like ring-hydroxylating dioxygenase large terminal subunit